MIYWKYNLKIKWRKALKTLLELGNFELALGRCHVPDSEF